MSTPVLSGTSLLGLARRVREPVDVVARRSDGMRGLSPPEIDIGEEFVVLGTLPALYPEWLGDRSFGDAHGVRFPYVAGEMALGISTTLMVREMARADMLCFFGAGGVDLADLDRALDELAGGLAGRRNWGVNLIHSPMEPAREDQVAERLLMRGVPCISMSAFTAPTPAVVRCAATGLRQDRTGRVLRPVSVFAKVSRPEVAEKFMSPAPAELLRVLKERGQLTEDECRLAASVAVAEDITVEADSAGHTDNRPMVSVFPAVSAMRGAVARRHGEPARPVRLGAAGGLGDPSGVAAAFALGAAYVLTGTVNQLSVEAGTSDAAKAMLAQADIADVVMAPALDMFELGVRVQVLRRGTRFPGRASRLRRAYQAYPSLEAIPADERAVLEREVLGLTLAEVWDLTCLYWQRHDPTELVRARSDPKHRMALVFRWYLSQSTRWAISGDAGRVADYQLWCSAAAGAFNRWTAGTFLADPAERTVVQIARNLLEGAAVLTRAHQLRSYGVALPMEAFTFAPRRLQ